MVALILDGGYLLSGIFATLFCLITAGFASRRVCLGLNGWIRHLPADGTLHRRMAGIGVFIAQIPVLTILAGLAFITMKLYQVAVAPFLAGLPLAGLACGLCVLPSQKKFITRPMLVFASVSLASNSWAILGVGILLLIASDVLSGPLAFKKKHTRFHNPVQGSLLVAIINWRALRLRPLIPYLLSMPFLGAAQLFITNNKPEPLLTEQVIRFGGALSLVLFCAILANLLAARRPPWPWIRSLPWSAKSRIAWDAFFIAVHALPLVIFIGLMNLKVVLPIAAGLPLLGVYSAYSIRRAPESAMGASGKVLLLGSFSSLFLCLFPWGSLLFLALTPLVLIEAIKAEKRQKVSRWLELHHLAAGDSLSWSE